MSRSENEAFAKRAVKFYDGYAGKDINVVIQHFKKEGKSRVTIRRIINRYKLRGTINYLKLPGRQSTVSTQKNVTRLKKLIKKNPTLSVRKGAKRIGIPKSTYSDIKIHKLGIKAYKRETIAKHTEEQKQRAKKNCKKILNKAKKKILLIDDETYVPIDPEQIEGNDYYHCEKKEDIHDDIRFKYKLKFPKRYLVWQVLDEKGNVSKPYISTESMNGRTYLEECLKKILLPFIKQHHEKDDVLLWMDMASSHYHHDVIQWLQQNEINFIEKKENAPNVPIARPIERFWALCKQEYHHRKKPAKTLKSFSSIWSSISKKVAKGSAQNLMKNARKNLKIISTDGVNAPYKQ